MKDVKEIPLFYEISEKEAASVSGGGQGLKALQVCWWLATGSVMLPLNVACIVYQNQQKLPSGGQVRA